MQRAWKYHTQTMPHASARYGLDKNALVDVVECLCNNNTTIISLISITTYTAKLKSVQLGTKIIQ